MGKMTPEMYDAAELVKDKCHDLVTEVKPMIEGLCDHDPRKQYAVMGTAFWNMAFVMFAMSQPDEDKFVELMNIKPLSDEQLRETHRMLHSPAH